MLPFSLLHIVCDIQHHEMIAPVQSNQSQRTSGRIGARRGFAALAATFHTF